MRHSVPALAVAAALAIAPAAPAADIEAGKTKAATVCAACHGATGTSVSDSIPNLAGQKGKYIEGQLKALRGGTRKSEIMNAIASQLSDSDIANVAAHFSAQQGSVSMAKSDFLPALAKTRMVFPENYKASFTRYHAMNFPDTKQVRYYYANSVALRAAKAGAPLPDGSVLFAEVYLAKLDSDKQPVTGSDGFFVADKLQAYTEMEREAGWGAEVPDMLRNENWNYAVFTAEKQPRAGVNQAECLACHKPLDKSSFTFTLKELVSTAKAN